MSIIKNKLVKKFSTIPNEIIVDDNISPNAFRVYCYLVSKPDNWSVYNKDIQNNLKIKSSHSLAKYWKELEQYGWIDRTKQQNGTFIYQLLESSKCQSLADVKKCQLLKNDIHNKNNYHSNTELINNTDIKNIKKENDTSKNKPSKEEINFAFTTFYENYGVKKSKEQARKAFNKLKPEVMQKVLDVVQSEEFQNHQKTLIKQNGDFRKHPSTWLNQGCWEDDLNVQKQRSKFDW